MKSLLITSTRQSAGKTVIGIGIALSLKGKKLGYFKPFGDRLGQGDGSLYDEDAKLFKETLALEDGIESLSVAYDYSAMLWDNIDEDLSTASQERFEEVAEGKELMLIESARDYSYGAYVRLDASSISKMCRCGIVVVADGDIEMIIDKCIAAAAYFKSVNAKLIGAIINNVSEANMRWVDEIVLPALELRDISVKGIVPADEVISTVTPGLIAEKLDAKVLAGEPGLDRSVREMIVGAMNVEAVLRHPKFKKPDKLLITGDDRTELQLAAFDTSTSCLLLTGNIPPEPIVLSMADEAKIPVLLMRDDTLSVVRQIEGIEALLRHQDADKLAAVKENVYKHVDIDEIIAEL